jgi:hypothetical protein
MKNGRTISKATMVSMVIVAVMLSEVNAAAGLCNMKVEGQVLILVTGTDHEFKP